MMECILRLVASATFVTILLSTPRPPEPDDACYYRKAVQNNGSSKRERMSSKYLTWSKSIDFNISIECTIWWCSLLGQNRSIAVSFFLSFVLSFFLSFFLSSILSLFCIFQPYTGYLSLAFSLMSHSSASDKVEEHSGSWWQYNCWCLSPPPPHTHTHTRARAHSHTRPKKQ